MLLAVDYTVRDSSKVSRFRAISDWWNVFSLSLSRTLYWSNIIADPLIPQLAGNSLLATHCNVASGNILRKERSFNHFFLIKVKWKAEAIFETYELLVYGEMQYITNLFCKNMLRIVAP